MKQGIVELIGQIPAFTLKLCLVAQNHLVPSKSHLLRYSKLLGPRMTSERSSTPAGFEIGVAPKRSPAMPNQFC